MKQAVLTVLASKSLSPFFHKTLTKKHKTTRYNILKLREYFVRMKTLKIDRMTYQQEGCFYQNDQKKGTEGRG